ncbi:g6567 [Coccomyxa elongata]
MADVAEPVKVTAESLGVSRGDEYEGELQYDLGNMMASDHGPLDQARFRDDTNRACLEVATQTTQSLVARLFELPSEAALEGRIAHLPAPTTPLPRAKPLPQPRAPTKWEAFAQRKGIVKKKRSKEVWDEDTGEYRRRFGYKRAGDESEVRIIEASADDKVGEDPFTKLKQEKRERVKDQQKRQLQNIKASAKAVGSSAAVPPTLKLAAALPAHGKGKPTKRKDMHDDIKQASRQAGVSTASMGKFDERLPGEKPGERVISSKRQKFDPVSGKSGTELKKAAGLVDRIIREHADDIMDADKAVRRVEAERHSQLASAQAQDSDEEQRRPSREGDKSKKSRGRGGKATSTKGQRFAALKRADKGGRGFAAAGNSGRGGRGASRGGRGKSGGRGGGRGLSGGRGGSRGGRGRGGGRGGKR